MIGAYYMLFLRMKLLLGYLLTYLVSIILGNLIIFMSVRHTTQTNIEKELTTTTNIIMSMVKSSTDHFHLVISIFYFTLFRALRFGFSRNYVKRGH